MELTVLQTHHELRWWLGIYYNISHWLVSVLLHLVKRSKTISKRDEQSAEPFKVSRTPVMYSMNLHAISVVLTWISLSSVTGLLLSTIVIHLAHAIFRSLLRNWVTFLSDLDCKHFPERQSLFPFASPWKWRSTYNIHITTRYVAHTGWRYVLHTVNRGNFDRILVYFYS